jgi:myo-inositol-1(or 4)-monophosphatase
MKDFELRILTKEVTELTRSIGMTIKEEIKRVTDKDVQEKGTSNFVTYVDKVAEETIVHKLRSLFPEAGYLTEEGTAREQKEYMWVVDPLDGTTNFIHNVPLYSVSIALRHKNETIAGVVYEPNLDECFYSWKGGGAYLNDRQIHVSGYKKLSDSLIATGFPYHKDKHLSDYMGVLQAFLERSHGIRRLGSAAVDLAYVACGRYEAFYEYGLKPWDIAAGAFIVQQAGGKVSDFGGGNEFTDGNRIVASNSAIHTQLTDILSKNMF